MISENPGNRFLLLTVVGEKDASRSEANERCRQRRRHSYIAEEPNACASCDPGATQDGEASGSSEVDGGSSGVDRRPDGG